MPISLRKKIFLGTLSLLFTLTSKADVTVVNLLSDSQKKELETIMANHLKNQKLPSIAIAATRGGTVFWFDTLGYTDYDNKYLAHPFKTLYRWASVSKLATARMAYSLGEKGVLDLDESIGAGANSYYYPLLSYPTYRKRCFSESTIKEYASCTYTYGNVPIFSSFKGRCFDPKSFDSYETSKNYNAWIVDKSESSGDFVVKDSNGHDKCRVKYSITHEELDANEHQITVRDLLNHKGGIQHYKYLDHSSVPADALLTNVDKVKERKDKKISQMAWAIPTHFPKHPLVGRPGQTKEYSSFGYNLAGVVMESSAKMRYEDILKSYTAPLGANSIQADYLGISPEGVAPGNLPYHKTRNYKRENGQMILNDYKKDISYKLAGGGIISNIVDMARFCVGITNDHYFTKSGAPSISHSGAHPDQSKSLLVSKKNKDGNPQCLVLATNTEHDNVNLEAIRKEIESKMIEFGFWKDE